MHFSNPKFSRLVGLTVAAAVAAALSGQSAFAQQASAEVLEVHGAAHGVHWKVPEHVLHFFRSVPEHVYYFIHFFYVFHIRLTIFVVLKLCQDPI